MATTIKKKLCWNCDGQVPLAEENCTFCGVYLGPSPEDEASNNENILKPPYKIIETEDDFPQNTSTPKENTQAILEQPEDKSAFVSLTLLSLGTFLFVFGLILALFSSDGYVTLRWSSAFWYLYALIACPCLFFGWKLMQR